MKIMTNHELTERVELLHQGVSKLIDCYHDLQENQEAQCKVDSLQLIAHTTLEHSIELLDKRLDHMEEYMDKLVKRVKELEANNSNTNTHNCSQHSNCVHRYK